MDRDALVAECERRFRDESNGVYDADDWSEYLQTAAMQVNQASPLWPWMEGENASFTVTTSGVATLPSDTIAVISVYDVTNEADLQQLHGVRARHTYFTTDEGDPEAYRVKGTQLQVFPLPTASITLRVQYVAGAALLATNTDEPPFPEVFHRILVDGALAAAHDDDDNSNQSDRHFAAFQRGIENLKQAVLPYRGGGEYPVIQDDYWMPVG